ncbi:conserved Plasmodium protein, unknown function [Plasmodium relictum]|uniref:Uncharacterized protein n=1 Tax=Plasmodium relictum TaxID=85471 RepID=A0A1J1H916_PLARL|nr:conserved Plasmodium protein, unknown function [Plasmodium relictum]CRH00093.1 conserved Plasmodium protein, unknown function [Plasmodium relictum]
MQNFVDLDHIRTSNVTSENHHKILKNVEEVSENNNNNNKNDQNCLISENMHNNISYVCNNNIDDKHTLKHLKTKDITDQNFLIHSDNYLRNNEHSKEIFKNDESNTKNLEEAVNRRRKIREMISAYNSLNLSSCNLDNIDIQKKISLHHFDYNNDEDDKCESFVKKNIPEENYTDKFHKNQNKKENNYNYDSSITYKNNDISSCNNYSYYCNNDNIKSRINENILDKSFINDDDEMDDYKTFLTLDSNQTIFKKKPLKLPDISFLNNSSRNYNTMHNDDNDNDILRKKIIYEKLDLSSFCYDDNKNINFLSQCNGENSTLQKRTGINEFNKVCVDNNISFYELKKESKNNIVKNYIKINKVENSNIEQLINNNLSHSNNYVDKKIKSYEQKHLKENSYANRLSSKNDLDNAYFKYYNLHSSRKPNDKNNNLHSSTVKTKKEQNINFINKISNASIVYSSELKYSNLPENISKKNYKNYNNSKYENIDNEHLNDKVKFSLEEKTYLNSSYIKNIEKFKELLINATKDNLNEYVKCLQNINNKKLRNYKHYVKQVNNYSISQYLNTTFRASVPQKNIRELMLNNSDTFSSIQKCLNESDDLSTTTHSDNSSISNFTYKSLINSNNNNNNLSLKIYKRKKKYHLRNTSTLSTTSTNEINSCSEKIKNEISFSLANKNRQKKYDKSSYSFSNVNPKLENVINKNNFPNIKENDFYNLKRLDNLNVKNVKKEQNLDINDSLKSNYIKRILKKKNLYEPLENYIVEKKICNSDYANNYKNYDKDNFKENEYICSLKKKKKKKRNINNNINYIHSSKNKNKNKNYFPFNTDSEDYNKKLNSSSVSLLRSNSCENNYKKLLSNDELNKSNNQTNNTTNNKNILYIKDGDNNIKYEDNNYHEVDKFPRQSLFNCTNNFLSKNVLSNINQDNVNEENMYELGQIRKNEDTNGNNSCESNRSNMNNEDFSYINFLKNRNFINIHDNASKNGKMENNNVIYLQNDTCESNINNDLLNKKKSLCLSKKNSEDFPMYDKKLIKIDSLTKERNKISYKDSSLIRNNNLFYFNNVDDKNEINSIEKKNENILLNNIKRENFDNSIFINKKEKDSVSIDVLNFNFQSSPNNNVNLNKNNFEIPNNIQEYNCQYPEHANKSEGRDIGEIIRNNKTRIENLYDNEPSQSDYYLSENTSECKYNINENIEDNKNSRPFLNKYDYFYKSLKENSYSFNSYKEDIENKSVIGCSLDSFNEEFDNPISAPTPAASSFSNISLNSSYNKNFNKLNVFNLKNNQNNNVCEIHNHLNDQKYYMNIDELKKGNFYNNNNSKSNYDKSSTGNKNFNNSKEKNINLNLVSDKNKHNIYENHRHTINTNKGENSYSVNHFLNKKYEMSNASTNFLKNNINNTENNFDFINNKKYNDNSQILIDKKYTNFTNVFKDNINKKNISDTFSESTVNNRKSLNSIITNNINNLDKNLIHNNENIIIQKPLYKEIYNNYTFSKKNNSPETLTNNLINLTEPNWNYKKTNKNSVNKIVNTLEIKDIKINTKQGIFEITSVGEVIFTFLGRSEIKRYKNVKKKNMNIDISKPRKLLFIIEIDGINIKIKDVLMNEVLDYYNIFEEELPKTHNARYEYAYNVVETLKKHTPKVSLTKKWFGTYHLMSNGSTPDFIAILNNNMFIEKVEIKNNHVTFILKDRTSITIHNDDLNEITTNFTKKTIEEKEKSVNDSKGSYNFLKEMKGDNEDIKIILMNLQKLLKKTGVSIDIIIQNWCNTLHAYSHCLSLLTKGNAEYTLKLKKALADMTEKTEIHRRNIYFSIFPIIIEE